MTPTPSAEERRRAAEWVAATASCGSPTERAGEIIWALASPDVARLFCGTRGWSNDEYAAWLEDSLVRVLLPDVAPAASTAAPPDARRLQR